MRPEKAGPMTNPTPQAQDKRESPKAWLLSDDVSDMAALAATAAPGVGRREEKGGEEGGGEERRVGRREGGEERRVGRREEGGEEEEWGGVKMNGGWGEE